MSEVPLYLEAGPVKFIVSHGIIEGRGLQFPGTHFVDKTAKPPESTYKTTFLVLSRIWHTICTRAWSPFPLIIPWKSMKLTRRECRVSRSCGYFGVKGT